MKRLTLILCVMVVLLLAVFALQNRFLFGLPFIHPRSEMADVERYIGRAEYYDGIGLKTDSIYYVRIFDFILATVNVNINSQGNYMSDGTTSTVTHPVNSITWTRVGSFDSKEALRISLPHNGPS